MLEGSIYLAKYKEKYWYMAALVLESSKSSFSPCYFFMIEWVLHCIVHKL